MDHSNWAILSLVLVDKMQVERKSPNMEVLGAEKTLLLLQEAGLNVVKFVTDAHPQIAKLIYVS